MMYPSGLVSSNALKAYLADLDYSLSDENKNRAGFFYWNTFYIASLLNGTTSAELSARKERVSPKALNIVEF